MRCRGVILSLTTRFIFFVDGTGIKEAHHDSGDLLYGGAQGLPVLEHPLAVHINGMDTGLFPTTPEGTLVFSPTSR
jgi:hypothetical protein